MHQLNPKRVALVLGVFLSGFHALWSLLIVVGVAQPILDFVFWMHMIEKTFVVSAFDATAAGALIALTFVVGYVGGFAFGHLWNRLHK